MSVPKAALFADSPRLLTVTKRPDCGSGSLTRPRPGSFVWVWPMLVMMTRGTPSCICHIFIFPDINMLIIIGSCNGFSKIIISITGSVQSIIQCVLLCTSLFILLLYILCAVTKCGSPPSHLVTVWSKIHQKMERGDEGGGHPLLSRHYTLAPTCWPSLVSGQRNCPHLRSFPRLKTPWHCHKNWTIEKMGF